jgi:hypothetical protein
MNYLSVTVDSECRKTSTSGMTLAQNSSDNIIYFQTPTRYSNVRAHFRFPNGIVSYILHMVYVGYDSDTQLYRYGLQIPYAVTNFTMPSATARLSVSFHCWKEDDFSKGGEAVCDTSIVVNRSSNTDVYDPSYNGTDIDNLWRYLGNISSEIDEGGSLPHVLPALPSNLSNYPDGTILCVQSDNELVFYRIKTAVAYKIGYGLAAIKTELDDHETRISQMEVYGDRISQCEADIASLKTRMTTAESGIVALNAELDNEESARAAGDQAEATSRASGDTNLQSQIDTINATQNVVDIVSAYAALLAYVTTNLQANDKIEVLLDERHDNADTIYSWNGSSWDFVGKKSASYTKAETDSLVNALSAIAVKSVNGNTPTNGNVDIAGLFGFRWDSSARVLHVTFTNGSASVVNRVLILS